jgi:hypothetical protein
LRRRDHVRARLLNKESMAEAKNANELQQRCDKLTHMMNGDPRIRRLQHYEVGCCPGGPVEMKSKMVTAILEAGLLLNLSTSQTSINRWGSTLQTAGEEALGCMICGVLPTVFTNAFPRWTSGDPGEQEVSGVGAGARSVYTCLHVARTHRPPSD